MKKVYFLIVIIVLCGCSPKNTSIQKTNTDINVKELEMATNDNYLKVYQTLSKLNLENSLENMGLSNEEVDQYSKEVLGDFSPKAYSGNVYPPELIIMFEKVLYDYKYSKSNWGIRESYEEILQRLEADRFQATLEDMYIVFPELESYKNIIKTTEDAYQLIKEPKGCKDVFKISMKPNDNYFLIKYQSGGSNGAYSAQLVKMQDGHRIVVSEFEQQNDDGHVIQYGNNYYYVSIERNYDLKTSDGIRIHKIEPKAEMDNILIRFLPNKYSWKTIYNRQTEYSNNLNQYIEGMKDDITSKYISNDGTESTSLLYGEESKKTDIISWQGRDIECGILDFANLGMPVYISKYLYYPSNALAMHIVANFYFVNTQTKSVVMLDNLTQDDRPPELKLIQMWFKQIDDKVFTFRIYNVSSYNYVLNTVLIEGDKITEIRTDLFSPQKQFDLVEGKDYSTIG